MLLLIVQQPVKSHMKRIVWCLVVGGIAVITSACAAATEASIQDAPTTTATATEATPTPTIVWFPPSETPTAQSVPTQAPTPERKPGVGQLLLTDDFTAPTPWNPGVSEDAGFDVSHNRLTIAAQPGVNAFRVRQGPTLTNFYAEITAQPSLCRGGDEYGLLFRAPSNAAFYAFTLTCNGTASAERVRLGRSYPLHDPVPSADVPLGAPGEVRLGVWVSGPDMRFFLNGRYQFGVTDPSYKAGSLGAFVRSMDDTPVTVTFSDLSIYKVTYITPSATPLP
jgi:hypothetical protein